MPLPLAVVELVVVEPLAAGAAGADDGVAVEPLPVLSDAAGVFVLSFPAAAGFSDVSLPEPGFILSE